MCLFFAKWTENVLQKSHSVNMCIIIHSSGCIVCLLWPHFQRARKQAGGVGSQNKGLSSPPAWASEMLTTQPAQSLSPGFWPPMSDSWITENFSQVQEPGDYTVKIFLQNSNLLIVEKTVRKLTIEVFFIQWCVWFVNIWIALCQHSGSHCKQYIIHFTGCEGQSSLAWGVAGGLKKKQCFTYPKMKKAICKCATMFLAHNGDHLNINKLRLCELNNNEIDWRKTKLAQQTKHKREQKTKWVTHRQALTTQRGTTTTLSTVWSAIGHYPTLLQEAHHLIWIWAD